MLRNKYYINDIDDVDDDDGDHFDHYNDNRVDDC